MIGRTVKCCLGFAFNTTGDSVVLIRKLRPAFILDKLNGLGGKLEAGETPAQAMQREAREEADIDTDAWVEFAHFGVINDGVIYHVNCFKIFSTHLHDTARTMTDEIVSTYSVHNLPSDCVPSAYALIQMAKNPPEAGIIIRGAV